MKFLLLLPLLWNVSFAEDHSHHHQHEEMQTQKSSFEDTVFGVPGEWENQKGEKFRLQNLAGKPHLFTMLYTRCKTACPLLVEDVKNVVKALPADEQKMDVVLFSIDAESETQKSLAEFSKSKKLPEHWTVARASAKDVTTLAAVLGVNFKRLPDGEYVHSNSIFYIDANGKLAAQQDGLNKLDPDFVKSIKASLANKGDHNDHAKDEHQSGRNEGFGLFDKTKKFFKDLFSPKQD